jgi:phosphoglycolate phosphatase
VRPATGRRVKVLLFDVDGTLVRTGGAGVRAMERAAERALGVAGVLHGLTMGGGIDHAQLRAGLRRHAPGRFPPGAAEDAALRAVLDVYPAELEDEIARTDAYRVPAGVHAALAALAAGPVARGEALVGLGTGNVEVGARIKLARGGLNEAFPFGGFADDAEERPEVLRAGVRRAEARAGGPIAAGDVTVVGDTLRDVEAARAIGARVVAVATGFVPLETLRAAQPDAVFPDLAAPGALEALVAAR